MTKGPIDLGLAESRLRGVVAEAGYGPDEPLVVAAARAGGAPLVLAQGVTSAGETVSGSTRFYAASLAKQVTAACAALLVNARLLDVGTPLSRWMPELPDWADHVRLDQLIYHTAALPPDADVDALIASVPDADRSSAGVVEALCELPVPERGNGTAHVYSNAGYVCLATVVQRAAGKPLTTFARQQLFAPAGMNDTCLWSGPDPAPPNAAPPTPEHPAPLSLGDGGLWSTVRDLLRWCVALDDDRFGISRQLQTAGRFDDGTELDCAWGIGVRTRHGHRMYRHGGAWANSRVLLVRAPDLGRTRKRPQTRRAGSPTGVRPCSLVAPALHQTVEEPDGEQYGDRDGCESSDGEDHSELLL